MHRSKSRRGAALPALILLLTPTFLAAQVPGETLEGPLTLEEAVRTALERNRDVRDAREGLQVARRQVTEAWGNVYPTLSLNASYTRNVAPPKSFLPAIFIDPEADPDELVAVQFGSDNQWNSTLSLEQPLFQFRAFVGVGAAGRFEALQEEILRGRSQEVATRVRLAYYDLLLAREQVRLLENSVARVREALEETEALARAGLASEYEVLRLQVEVANLEPTLRQAQNTVTRSRRVLAVELDLDPEADVEVEGSLAELQLGEGAVNSPGNEAIVRFAGVTAVDPGEVGALEGWLERRTDVRQSELTHALRNAELRAEQSDWFPEISLFGNYTVSAQQNGDPVFFGRDGTQRFTAQAVGINLSWTIFNGLQREARISQRRAQVRQASTQSELARDRSLSDLRSILEQLQEARLRAEGQRLAVEQAGRGYEIASAQYREGLGSRLELSDAEVALRQSEFNYAQAVYDVLAGQARLDEAAGMVPGVDRPLFVGGGG